MIFKDFPPAPVLKPFVQLYRLRHFIIPKNVPINSKPYPARPENCMAFYPRGFEITELVSGKREKKTRSVISGQYTERINRFSSPDEFLMILVVFKPGALHQMTGISFAELLNKQIDLEAVYPIEGRSVNERLSGTDSYEEMILIIESFLIRIVSGMKSQHLHSSEVFNLMLNSEGKSSLNWLANQACLSPRQFERKSDAYLGVSPRLFSRIIRFHQSYQRRLQFPNEDWFTNAIVSGYYDYQHLVRDYREFAHTTPNALFADESKAMERVLGLNK